MISSELRRPPYYSITGEGDRPVAIWYPELGQGTLAINIGRLNIHLNVSDASWLADQLRLALEKAVKKETS